MKSLFNKTIIGLIKLLSHIPLCVLYVFADISAFLLYRVVRYRLKVVRGNLEIMFPHKSEKERRAIEKRFYRHFADYVMETLKGVSIPKPEVLKRFVIKNPELIDNYNKMGRSVFIYSAHQGNWEWFITMPQYFPNCVRQTFYQPQSSKLVDDITLLSRTREGIVAVESQKGYRHIVTSQRNGVVATTLIIGDQSPHRGAQKHWTNFFGRDTAFLYGPATIGQKTNQVLVYPSYVGYKRGYYEIELRLITDEPKTLTKEAIIDRFAAYLEDDLNRYPELWLLSHRRWKHKHEDFPNE